MKKIGFAYILILVIMLVVFPATFLVMKNYVDTENHENREYAEKPVFSEVGYTQYFAKYEEYYNDHLPYKNQLSSAKSRFEQMVTGRVDNENVIMGKDNWLFYKVENSIDDYRGTVSISDEEIDKIIETAQRAQDFFDEHNIKLVFAFMPNKEEIESQYLPDRIRVVNENSRLDKIVEVMQDEGFDVVYPYSVLKDAAHDTYRKYDTHMNAFGSFIAAQEIIGDLGYEMISPYDIKLTAVKEEKAGDLALQLAMEDTLNDGYDYKIQGYYHGAEPEIMFFDSVKNNNVYHCETGEDVCLMIGDSFSNTLCTYMAPYFKSIVTMQRDYFTWETYTQVMPNVVVIEFVERQVPGRFVGDVNAVMDLIEQGWAVDIEHK